MCTISVWDKQKAIFNNLCKGLLNLLISNGFNSKSVGILYLFIEFTPAKLRRIRNFFAVKSKVNVTFFIHTRSDFLGVCNIWLLLEMQLLEEIIVPSNLKFYTY